MIVWVSGPTGSGKSTLAGLMSQVGYRLIREELPSDLFEAFSRNPTQHCASLQEAIMLFRVTQWHLAFGRRNVVFDRSVDEDVEVFCRMHYEHGLLDYSAYAPLRLLAKNLAAEIPKPELIIYLMPSMDVLKNRVFHGEHPQPVADNLERQVALYEEWIQSRREPVIRIDNSASDRGAIVRLFRRA